MGEYTSSAIASIAFNRKTAVVDENVIRVISRLFKIGKLFNESATFREIKEYALLLMDKHHPTVFNQAIMELGAFFCKLHHPNCCIAHCLLIVGHIRPMRKKSIL